MSDNNQLKALEEKLEQLTRKIGILEDTHAIRTLHFKYGYYIDKCLYDETVDLFAEELLGWSKEPIFLCRSDC